MQDIQDILIMLFGGFLLGVLILRGGNLGNGRKHGKTGRRVTGTPAATRGSAASASAQPDAPGHGVASAASPSSTLRQQ